VHGKRERREMKKQNEFDSEDKKSYENKNPTN
jgi:hypothetical protein